MSDVTLHAEPGLVEDADDDPGAQDDRRDAGDLTGCGEEGRLGPLPRLGQVDAPALVDEEERGRDQDGDRGCVLRRAALREQHEQERAEREGGRRARAARPDPSAGSRRGAWP